jgi:hypothetical protein
MIKLKDILQELIVGDKVHCDNCDWNWKIADGGDDLYMCHKCGHDNTPKLTEQSSNITDLFIGQARPDYNSDSILQNISTAGEKAASALLTKLGAIDIEVTPDMSTSGVSNEIKKLAVKGLILPGKLNSITISSHNTGCGKFNYSIMYSGGTATEFWNTLAKFCNSNTKIFLGGCSVASEPKTVARISKITKCEVTAPTGTYYPATGAVSKTKDSFNLPQRLGKYLTCTNKPAGDEGKYNKFIAAHLRDLFDSRTKLSIPNSFRLIRDFRTNLNYLDDTYYNKLKSKIYAPPLNGRPPAFRYTNDEVYKKQMLKLLSTILEALTIRLIKDYIKSLGCYTSKNNPIQSTRDAIFI